MNEIYRKYIAKLSESTASSQIIIKALSQAPLFPMEADIDARIYAAERLITQLQEARRYLIYFKNRVASTPGSPVPPKPPGAA